MWTVIRPAPATTCRCTAKTPESLFKSEPTSRSTGEFTRWAARRHATSMLLTPTRSAWIWRWVARTATLRLWPASTPTPWCCSITTSSWPRPTRSTKSSALTTWARRTSPSAWCRSATRRWFTSTHRRKHRHRESAFSMPAPVKSKPFESAIVWRSASKFPKTVRDMTTWVDGEIGILTLLFAHFSAPYGIFARSCVAMAKDSKSTFQIIDDDGWEIARNDAYD